MLLACKQSDLNRTSASIRFAPQTLDFGNVYVDGQPRELPLSVFNDSVSQVTGLAFQGLSAPFEVTLPVRLEPGEARLVMRYTPRAAGRMLQVARLEGFEAQLTVSANGVPIPSCMPSADCLRSSFDVEKGACVERFEADGTACDAKSVCILNGQCRSGRCIGEERTCSDGNACTVDVCNAQTGCEFLPRPPCPGDGECLAGVCDPRTGCGTVAAVDGTTCGSLQTCTAAEVCVTGQCVVRNPPEGYLCAEASPCQGEGRCVNDQCLRSTPRSNLVQQWSLDALTNTTPKPDGGPGDPKLLHDFVLEPSGAMSLSGFFDVPSKLRANTAQSTMTQSGPSRRCIIWSSRYVCADYPSVPNGRVSAVDFNTGRTVWSFDIRTSRPDFVEQTTQIFLARLVVQASDRLAAIFEAYPKVTNSNGQCRSYFLVVINAQGGLVMAQPLFDPLLSACNHPHPYGAVSDAVGNLFLAFSPTLSAQAPLKPGQPTLLLSYTRDGIFRWKVTDANMAGGELAVARGLLYPENGEVVRTAATGAEAFAVPQLLGRTVVADSRFIPAPLPGQTVLKGYEAGQPNLSWSHQLEPGLSFWSDQLRLATWATSQGPQTIALGFVRDPAASKFSLRGIRVHDGSEAFTCPIEGPMRTAPQLFEIANGSMGLMEGALDASGQPGCNKCDPPFANSAAAFHSYSLPGITLPRAPWVGTFGGAGHDHREEVDPSTPGNASN